jgi:hypothetical protein
MEMMEIQEEVQKDMIKFMEEMCEKVKKDIEEIQSILNKINIKKDELNI